MLAGNEVVPASTSDRKGRRQARRARRRRQRHLARLVVGAGLRLPRVRRQLRTSGSSVLNLDPLAHALRQGSEDGVRAVDPALVARPGLQLRLAVTALRAGVLRFVSEDGTIVESDARTPAPGPAAGPVDLVDGAIASASVPMVFPPHSMADDDYVDGGVIEIVPVSAAAALGATRIIAVVAVPLTLTRDERDYAAAPAGYIGLRSMGMIGVAERQIANLERPPARGDDVDDDRPRRRRRRACSRSSRGCCASTRTTAGCAPPTSSPTATPAYGPTSRTAPTPSSRRAARPGAWRSRCGPPAGSRPTTPGRSPSCASTRSAVRSLVDRRKQLGFPVPDGCEDWWTGYEAHTAERPQGLPAFSTGRA